jgi:hypothetical protein
MGDSVEPLVRCHTSPRVPAPLTRNASGAAFTFSFGRLGSCARSSQFRDLSPLVVENPRIPL